MWRLRLSLAMATPTASEKIYAHSPEAFQKAAGFRRQLVGSRNGAFILRGDNRRVSPALTNGASRLLATRDGIESPSVLTYVSAKTMVAS